MSESLSLFPETAPFSSPVNVPFTVEERRVYELVAECKGRAQALSIAAITFKTDIPARAVKEAVSGLRLRHRFKIGSSRGHRTEEGNVEGGYFMIKTAEDLDETIEPYFRQAVQMLRTVVALKGKSYTQELLGQMRLELEE